MLLLSILWIVFAGGTYFGIARFVPRTVTQGLFVLVVVAWLIAAWRSPAWRPRTVLAIPIALVLAVQAIATVFAAAPVLAQEPLAMAGAYALTYLVTTSLLRDAWFAPRVRAAFFLLTLVLVITAVGQVVVEWARLWAAVGRVFVPPLRPGDTGLVFTVNSLAALLLVMPPLAIAWAPRARRARPIVVALAVLSVAALIATASRGAWLGFGVASVVTAAGWFLAARGVPARGRPTRRTLGIAAAAVAGVLALAPVVVTRFATGGIELRASLWQTAVAAFASDPLTGIGPGNWPVWNFSRVSPDAANIAQPHAHNVYFQTLAEFGLLGAIAAAVFVAAVARLVLRAWRHPDRAARPLAAAATFAFVGLAVHQLVDVFMNQPAVVLAAMMPLAAVEVATERTAAAAADPGSLPARRPVAVAIALLAAVVALAAPAAAGNAAHAQAVDASYRRDWPAVTAELERALAWSPGHPLYQWELGVARSLAGTGDPRGPLDAASTIDRNAQLLVDRAWLALGDDDRAGAVELAREALERVGAPEPARQAPGGVVELNVGAIGERAGDEALAVEGYARSVLADPTILRAGYWQEGRRAALRRSVLERAAAITRERPELGALIESDIWLEAGDATRAAAALADAPASTGRDVRRAVLELGATPDVLRTRLLELAQAEPLAGDAVAWLARLALLRNDGPEFNRFRSWYRITAPGAELGAVRSRIPSDETVRGDSSLRIVCVTLYARDAFADLYVRDALTVARLRPEVLSPAIGR